MSTYNERELNKIKDHYKYVIIGGGVGAGYACNEFVKHQSPNRDLLIISSDEVPPYERPALTKAFLHPPDAEKRARLPGFHTPTAWGEEMHDEDWYKQNGVDVLLNTKVTRVDLSNKQIETNQDKTITYDKLIIGTGARPVMPSELNIKGSDLENVFTIRLIQDSSQLVKTLESRTTKKPVIIGGGYLGMECAAAISGWSHIEKVVMIFPESRLLERLFPPRVAEWFENRMRQRNIDFIKEQSISEIIEDSGRVSGVKLTNGEIIEADMVIAGIGATPNVELFKDQVEMAEDGGIKVDSQFRTSVNDVYAFGDVASFPSRYNNKYTRYEHVDNGRNTATHLVKCLLTGKDEPYDYTPYFYSRLFEYTDSPLIFRYFGKNVGPDGQQLDELIFEDDQRLGVFWIDKNNTIFGTMICNGTEENVEEMKKIAEQQPKITDVNNPVTMLTSW